MKLACWIDVIDHYNLSSNLCDDQLVNFLQIEQVVFSKNFGVLLETLCSSQFCELELILNLFSLHYSMHHDIYLFMHHIDFFLYFFCANLQSTLCFFFWFCFCVFVLTLAPCLGKLEPIGHLPLLLSLPLGVSCFRGTKAESYMRS